MKKLLTSIALVGCLFFTGCNTTKPTTDVTPTGETTTSLEQAITNALPIIRAGACSLASVAIEYGVSDSDKVVKCKCIYGLSSAVYTLTGGDLPTAQQLNEVLLSFAISDGQVYTNLVSSVTKLYSSYYAKLSGNTKLGVLVLNALAEGLADAASTYIK